jgi:FixJ family two-component response regulator
MSGDMEKAISAGCSDFITKPIKAKILLDKVGFFLAK